VPLRIATWLGLVGGVIAVLTGVAIVVLKLVVPGVSLPGWTGIMVALAFGFSAQLLMTGILGEYVGRIYEEIKRRPLYIVAREVNGGDESGEPLRRAVRVGAVDRGS